MSGRTSYYAGLHAEDAVANAYVQAGQTILARRWRGTAGEIDVIARDGEQVIFIEVKKSRTHDAAAERITRRQLDRIWQTAEEYLGEQPKGLNTEARFDVALVDATGRIEIVQNFAA